MGNIFISLCHVALGRSDASGLVIQSTWCLTECLISAQCTNPGWILSHCETCRDLFFYAGGGVTNLVMPRIYERIAEHQHDFIAWRWAYFVPGAMHITIATLVILFAQVSFLWPVQFAGEVTMVLSNFLLSASLPLFGRLDANVTSSSQWDTSSKPLWQLSNKF